MENKGMSNSSYIYWNNSEEKSINIIDCLEDQIYLVSGCTTILAGGEHFDCGCHEAAMAVIIRTLDGVQKRLQEVLEALKDTDGDT